MGVTVETEEGMETNVPPDPEDEGMFHIVERVLKPLRNEDIALVCQGHAGWHMAFPVRCDG